MDFSFSEQANKVVPYGVDSTGRKVQVTTSAVITKKPIRYGYLEVRTQAADGLISSSFWTTEKGGELDVFEHYGKNPENKQAAKRYHSSFHDWRVPVSRPTYGKRIWTNEHYLPFRAVQVCSNAGSPASASPASAQEGATAPEPACR